MDGIGLLISVCVFGILLYGLLHLVDSLDAQIQKRYRDSVDPDWWWEAKKE